MSGYLDISNLRHTILTQEIWKKQRRMAERKLEILESYNYKCCKCQSTEKLTIHHKRHGNYKEIIKKSKKRHKMVNYYRIGRCVILCMPCHIKEHENNDGVITPEETEKQKQNMKREFEEFIFNFEF